MQREEVNPYVDGLLEVSRYRNYCPNGRKVEGPGRVQHIAGCLDRYEFIHLFQYVIAKNFNPDDAFRYNRVLSHTVDF